jgi:ABC-type dipeptide/oligopeptide/nickel transport system permease component
MTELSQSIPLKKLPVLATIREALMVSWQHRAILFRWIIGCTLFAGAFCYLQEYLVVKYAWANKDWNPLSGRIFFFILSAFPTLMISAMFSVFCHRLVLLNGEVNSSSRIAFGKREWRFFCWNFTLCLAAIFIGLLAIIVRYLSLEMLENLKGNYGGLVLIKTFLDNYSLDILFYGGFSYLLAPYCLVLPATAVDLKPSLAWSSEQTNGNEMRLALLFGGLPFIFGRGFNSLVQQMG